MGTGTFGNIDRGRWDIVNYGSLMPKYILYLRKMYL
jgi:hypothetical protein